MAARYSVAWLYAARTAPLFAKRFKSIFVKYTNWARNVLVSSSPLAYQGYVEYAGGTLNRGYDVAEDLADFAQRYLAGGTPPAQFAIYFEGTFSIPEGVARVSGKKEKAGAKLRLGVQSYTATSRLSRGGQSFSAGIGAWLKNHRNTDAALELVRVQFVSTAKKPSVKRASPAPTAKKPKARNSAGRRNGRVQRSGAVRVRGDKRRTTVSRADNRAVSERDSKKKPAKSRKR